MTLAPRFRDWPVRVKLAVVLVVMSLAPVGVFVVLDSREAAPTKQRLILAAIIGLVALAISFLFATRILRRIGRLATATTDLAAGTLTTRVGADGHDELGKLGQAFNVMAARLESQAEVVRRTHDDLEALVTVRTAELARAKQQDEELQAKQVELEHSLKERDLLLLEVHHRVKNNLQVISSLINMQMRKLEQGSSRDALEECKTRIHTIALIHQKLYQSKNYSQLEFADYVRSLASDVFRALGVSTRAVSLEFAIDEIALGVDRAIPCGLVINELITNSLKHGFAGGGIGKIRIELAKLADGKVRLTVQDDGIGLPEGFDIQQVETMGLQLVSTLAEQLEASLVVNGDNGTSIQLTF